MKRPAVPASQESNGPANTPPAAPPEPDDAATGVPLFRTWRGVYWLVIISFVVWVAGLTALTLAFR